VRFDIILDHTAGFAYAIVCHGTGGRENGMRRELVIVAETRRAATPVRRVRLPAGHVAYFRVIPAGPI